MKERALEHALEALTNLSHGEGASAGQIELEELKLGSNLHADLRALLRDWGWISADEIEIAGIGDAPRPDLDLAGLTLSERSEMYPPLRGDLVALSNDGYGNIFCMLAGRSADGRIYLWDHERGVGQEPEFVAPSLEAWIRMQSVP